MADEGKKNRPSESRYWQQNLHEWSPVMTPLRIIIVLLSIGAAFIPTGLYLMSASDAIFEKTVVYDSPSSPDVPCTIKSANQGLQCPITITLPQDVTGPIYVYYQLTNFYQNHRKYAQSFYVTQLQGTYVAPDDTYLTSACDPLIKNGTKLLNPCGLVAASYFTDVISLLPASSVPTTMAMDETNIAWANDKVAVFKQPSDFKKAGPYSQAQASCAVVGLPDSCKLYQSGADFYYYYYPNADSTVYLYQMYPGLISPLEGVTNEHFMVWMKTAALPTFRKLYGKLTRASGSDSWKKGDVLQFSVSANFYVNSFQGTKALVLSTVGQFGAANRNIGIAYLVCGCLCGALGLLFLFVQLVCPKPPASKESLKWD